MIFCKGSNNYNLSSSDISNGTLLKNDEGISIFNHVQFYLVRQINTSVSPTVLKENIMQS